MQMYLDTLMIRTRKVFGKCEFDKKKLNFTNSKTTKKLMRRTYLYEFESDLINKFLDFHNNIPACHSSAYVHKHIDK